MNFNIIKSYIKPVIYTIVGLFVMYWMIYLLTPKPKMPTEYKAAIDSLTQSNKVLMERQKQLDNVITSYEAEVEKIDSTLHTIKEKTTIVKEFHHEIIERVNHYNAAQIDTFFRIRYNY